MFLLVAPLQDSASLHTKTLAKELHWHWQRSLLQPSAAAGPWRVLFPDTGENKKKSIVPEGGEDTSRDGGGAGGGAALTS